MRTGIVRMVIINAALSARARVASTDRMGLPSNRWVFRKLVRRNSPRRLFVLQEFEQCLAGLFRVVIYHAVVRTGDDDFLPILLGNQLHQFFGDTLEKRQTLLGYLPGQEQRRRRKLLHVLPINPPIRLVLDAQRFHGLGVSQHVFSGGFRYLFPLPLGRVDAEDESLQSLLGLPLLEQLTYPLPL